MICEREARLSWFMDDKRKSGMRNGKSDLVINRQIL